MKKVVALFVIFLIPAVSQARNYWGAIAYDKSTGRSAYAINHYTSHRARDAALHRCGHHCRVVKTFVNTCAALARGSHGAYAVTATHNRYNARRYARRRCHRNSGHSCRVVVSACNAKPHHRSHLRHY